MKDHTRSPRWQLGYALLHPAWVLSLVLLVLNDHVLKGAGLFPGWLTGKLSDLAGFFLFPALLGTLLRVRSRAGLLVCHGGAAALLFALELSPAFCALLQRLLGIRLVADPTDLVALLAIAASWAVFCRPGPGPALHRPAARGALLVAGCLACAATSPMDPSPRPLRGRIFLWNGSGKELQARVSVLRPEILFDCALAQSSPETLFSARSFVLRRHVTLITDGRLALDSDLEPNAQGGFEEAPPPRANLGAGGDCGVLLIAIEGSKERLVTFKPSAFPLVEADEAGAPPAERTVRIEAGSLLLTGPAMLLHPGPAEGAQAAGAGVCAAPAPGADPAWSPVVSEGSFQLTAASRGADGCDLLTLSANGTGERRATVCPEPLALPFSVGEQLRIRRPVDGSEGLVLESAQATLVLLRGAADGGVPGGCAPSPRRCGVARGGRVTIDTPAGRTEPLGQGQIVTRTYRDRTVTVAVQRAEEVVAADRACDAGAALGWSRSAVWIDQKN